MMHRPFHQMARDHHFSEQPTEKGLSTLIELTYEGNIEPFQDFKFVKNFR
jgi:hypothetical protein